MSIQEVVSRNEGISRTSFTNSREEKTRKRVGEKKIPQPVTLEFMTSCAVRSIPFLGGFWAHPASSNATPPLAT